MEYFDSERKQSYHFHSSQYNGVLKGINPIFNRYFSRTDTIIFTAFSAWNIHYSPNIIKCT